MNNDIFFGLAGAAVVHGAALFLSLPIVAPKYEVVVAESVIEVALVQTPPLKPVEDKPLLEPDIPAVPPQPVEEPEIIIEEKIEEPEPEEDLVEEVVEEPVEETEEIPEFNVRQGAVTEAKPIVHHNRPPEYPRIARRRGWEGRVVLIANVTKEGAVSVIRVEQSCGHSILDEAALEAIRQWRFEPALMFGSPVNSTLEIPVVFQLQ